MDFNKKKILIIAAHPDDEVFGCGGLIIKAKKSKSNIFALFLGEGVSARYKFNLANSKQSLAARKIREKEAIKCLNFLKIDQYKFEYRLCTRFDELPILNIVQSIESVINEFKPSLIFTHSNSEVNIDHRITYEATEIATRPFNKKFIKSIYSYQVPCSGNWVFNDSFNPNTFIDIKDCIDDKIKACNLYKTEMHNYPHPRSDEALKNLSSFRGIQSGLKYAEAFKLERSTIS